MKLPKLIFFLSFALSCAVSSAPQPADAEARWTKLLSQVGMGMRRAAVDKVLARSETVLDFELDPKPEKEKRGRTAIYLLDDEWCAAITFDSSGFTTRKNPHLLLHLPENKVIEKPRLWRRDAALNERLKQQATH